MEPDTDVKVWQILFDAVEKSCIVEVICDLCFDDDLNEMLLDSTISDISSSKIWCLLAIDKNVSQICSDGSGRRISQSCCDILRLRPTLLVVRISNHRITWSKKFIQSTFDLYLSKPYLFV